MNDYIDITSFYDHFGGYEVIYKGKTIVIDDEALGRIDLQSSEHTLLFLIEDKPAHVIKGIVGDITRYYKRLVKDQKELIACLEDKVYNRFKRLTVGQIYPNSGRNSTESSKAPTDTLIKTFLRDDLKIKNEYLEPRDDIEEYQQARKGLRELEEIYDKLENSLSIVTDNLKIAVTLNVNERERDKAQNYANGTKTHIGKAG